jgi:hypothetical protein
VNTLHAHVDLALRAVAITQLAIAILNLFLFRIMKWKADLKQAPLLIRQVFQVHCIFISITLSIFAVLTWRFASEIATGANPLCVWLAAGIGLFWIIRSALQWLYYSASHWRGNAGRTAIHWVLFLGYSAFAAVYFTAAFWRTA